MDYSFLVDTYAGERLKTLNVWSMFLGESDKVRQGVRPADVQVAYC